MQRRGMTLIEVLVAIFVMAIGLIAILALFPIGVLRMAQALQDARTGSIRDNADAIANMKKIRGDSAVTAAYTSAGVPSSGPSLPVLVDPLGYQAASGTPSQNSVAGLGAGVFPRVTPSFVASNDTAYRWFSFLDEIYFKDDGTPETYAGGGAVVYDREYRFSWAYLCQLADVTDSALANLTVVVYNRRTLSPTGGMPLGETEYPISTFNLQNNTVAVDYSLQGSPPAVRVGEWILDATTNAAMPSPRHATFHRVVAVNDLGGNLMEYEVQTPFRGFSGASQPGRIIVLEGVVEVFERGTGRR